MLHRQHKFALGAIPLALTMALSGCMDLTDDTETTEKDKVGTGEWELVWSDEFEGATIDRSKWAFEENCWGGGNQEQQCYVDSDDNAFVQDGNLHIKVIKGDTTGPAEPQSWADSDPAETVTLPYSSARLRTVSPHKEVEGQDPTFDFRNDWKYGRFEIRAKLPHGQGTWPAIWMLPTDWEYGGWAASGEIDIMEAVNLHTTYEKDGETLVENRTHGTLHYGSAWPNNTSSGNEYDFGSNDINPADDFHTYAIEWEEGEIRWYVDDNHFATQGMEGWYSHYQDENGEWTSASGAAPFNQKFHLIMNVAMGGGWPTAVNQGGIDDTILEQEMLVDFVRVYQCSANTETGVGCGTISDDATFNPGKAEPELPGQETEVDTSGPVLNLFTDELLPGISLDGWDPNSANVRTITENGEIKFEFNEGGTNAYLKADLPFDMGPYAAGGELSFDLTIVDNGGTADALVVKMDSGYPSLAPITIDKADWDVPGFAKTFTYTVDEFIAAGVAHDKGFNIHGIVNPVVFEPVNNDGLHILIDNISFTKGEGVEAPEPVEFTLPLPLFTDAVEPGFDISLYHGWEEAEDDSVDATGDVISVAHNGGGNLSVVADAPMNFSSIDTAIMKFSLRVVDAGTATDILIKMQSGDWPNLSDIPLSSTSVGMPTDNDWHDFAIPVASFVAAKNSIDPSGQMDISKVTAPFVIEASGGGNLSVEIDNIRFEAE